MLQEEGLQIFTPCTLDEPCLPITAQQLSFFRVFFSLTLIFLPRRAAVLHFTFGRSHSHHALRKYPGLFTPELRHHLSDARYLSEEAEHLPWSTIMFSKTIRPAELITPLGISQCRTTYSETTYRKMSFATSTNA